MFQDFPRRSHRNIHDPPSYMFTRISAETVFLQDSPTSILIIIIIVIVVNTLVIFQFLRYFEAPTRYREYGHKNLINASFTSCFTLSILASSSNVKIQSRYRTQASLCTTTRCNQHTREWERMLYSRTYTLLSHSASTFAPSI